MKQDQNLRFVIIGMGYLMEYIAPCYSKLLGDKKAEQMLGVTAEPQAVQTKAKATGIPVILNDNAGALRRMEPDIILFAPPPSLAAPLTESVLVPYFAECRAAGKELPMLFTFPPKPEGKYYQEQLGHDCKVVNILPNMISEICGRTKANVYAASRSISVNGLSSNSIIVNIVPWWEIVLLVVTAICGIAFIGCTVACVVMTYGKKNKKVEG